MLFDSKFILKPNNRETVKHLSRIMPNSEYFTSFFNLRTNIIVAEVWREVKVKLRFAVPSPGITEIEQT